MIFVSLLSAYILIGLIVACALYGYTMLPSSPYHGPEDIAAGGFLWPVVVIAVIVGAVLWTKHQAEGWFYRTLATAF